MRSLFYLLISLVITGSCFAQGKFDLKVKNISDGGSISLPGKYIYLYGTVDPSVKIFTVNGAETNLAKDGAFLAFAPVEPLNDKNEKGYVKSKLTFKMSDGKNKDEVEKVLWVKFPPETSTETDKLIDDLWPVKPFDNIHAKPGSKVEVEAKGIPGSKVYFTVGNSGKKYPMPETYFPNNYYWGEAVFGSGLKAEGDTVNGIYRGYFHLPPALRDSVINITFEHPEKGEKTVLAPGKIFVYDNNPGETAKIKFDPNLLVARYAPGGGYKLFLHEGIKLEVTGRYGNWLKVRLRDGEHIYIPEGAVDIEPEGTPPADASITIIRVNDNEKAAVIDFGFTERVPVEIRQYDDPSRIEVLAYNVSSNIDWVFFPQEDGFVKDIRHYQTADGLLKTEIYLDQKTHWGYTPEYDGNIFKLKINKPAHKNDASLTGSTVLKGRRISIDPGHSKDWGAVGPRGLTERYVNFDISVKLKKMLEDAGAEVFLTRSTKDEDLPLRERKDKVMSFTPEISISVHNNAVPQGMDPMEHNGSSVYYYYPQARELAGEIHRNFIKELGLKNFGFYWDNLYMTRITGAISILIEPAFIIVPGQEAKLKSEEFQEKIALSVYNAIKKFYEEYAE